MLTVIVVDVGNDLRLLVSKTVSVTVNVPGSENVWIVVGEETFKGCDPSPKVQV